MAGVRTLGNLKARIADELIRPDLSSQIVLAIQDAILEAASNRFWFNEVRGLALPLIAGQEYYTNDDLSALTEIDAIWFVLGGRRSVYPIGNIDVDQMSEGGGFTGEPYRYARYGDAFRFYPIPGSAYTIYIDGVSRLSPLVADSDLNGWTNEGERLIRAIAKRELLLNVIQGPDSQGDAQVQQLIVDKQIHDLKSQSYDRAATGQMAYNG